LQARIDAYEQDYEAPEEEAPSTQGLHGASSSANDEKQQQQLRHMKGEVRRAREKQDAYEASLKEQEEKCLSLAKELKEAKIEIYHLKGG